MHEITMPRLSDSMVEGTIVRWLKASGDEVRRGEEIVEIETDKATMGYEADFAGTLTIVAAAGATLAVGTPIATIGVGTSDPTPPAAAGPAPGASSNGGGARAGAVALAATPAGGSATGSPRIKAAPVARRAAQRLGIDLESVVGTGPYGRILKADVVAASALATSGPTPAPAPPAVQPAPVVTPPLPAPVGAGQVTLVALTRTQEIVARRMVESRTTVPDFSLEVDVDMTAAVSLRAELRQIADPAPSLNDFVIKACSIALRRHPRVNGGYRDGRFELRSDVNVGLAVAADDALLVPVVHRADTKSLGAIAAETRALAERVRSGTVTPPELSDGTFTVSNLGMYGIDRFEGIINAPQAAILCVGAVRERPVARDGQLAIAPQMTLTLASDHRILYGVDAAAFLAEVRTLLEQPLALAL